MQCPLLCEQRIVKQNVFVLVDLQLTILEYGLFYKDSITNFFQNFMYRTDRHIQRSRNDRVLLLLALFFSSIKESTLFKAVTTTAILLVAVF